MRCLFRFTFQIQPHHWPKYFNVILILYSYSSVKLTSMASAFGVSVDFIDKELARFVAAGRIHCKIDKVNVILSFFLFFFFLLFSFFFPFPSLFLYFPPCVSFLSYYLWWYRKYRGDDPTRRQECPIPVHHQTWRSPSQSHSKTLSYNQLVNVL